MLLFPKRSLATTLTLELLEASRSTTGSVSSPRTSSTRRSTSSSGSGSSSWQCGRWRVSSGQWQFCSLTKSVFYSFTRRYSEYLNIFRHPETNCFPRFVTNMTKIFASVSSTSCLKVSWETGLSSISSARTPIHSFSENLLRSWQ